MKPSLRTNGLLSACVLLLLVLCWASVSAPLRFARQRQQREAVVKERLLLIRQAQAAYLRAKGSYAADLHTLVAGGYMADSVQYIPYAGGKRFSEYHRDGRKVGAQRAAHGVWRRVCRLSARDGCYGDRQYDPAGRGGRTVCRTENRRLNDSQ